MVWLKRSMPMIFTIGGLAGQSLASNACFATLPISLIVLGSMLSATPVSAIMQRHGRRALHGAAPFTKGEKPAFHTPLDNFAKLRLWQLPYDRVVFLDADTLVLRNIDRLFRYPEFCAAPNVYEGLADFHRLNSGVFTARPDPDGNGWILNGTKRYITNAPIANMFVVFAKLDPKPESGNGIAVFLVPADTAGIEVGVKDAKMGQQGSGTADVNFTDVRVEADALVGGNGDIGYKAAMTSLARGRVHIAALAVGQAQRALDESVSYAAASTQGGEPIGNFQLVQAMIADQQVGVMAGRAMVREAARAWVQETDRRIAPSAVKLFCTEMVGKVADLAVQIHGGAGYMREVPVERIYRDVRLLRLYEGTSEIQRLIVGGGLIRAEQKRNS